MRSLFVQSLLFVCQIANAASIDYEIYDFTENPEGVLVAEGTKTYEASDVEVEERTSKDGTVWWDKTIWLNSSFGIGASIYRENRVRGFGLTGEISKEECDRAFSWEWFDIPFGLNLILKREVVRFEKLQESGQIEVRFIEIDGEQEIAEITLLTDISLRINTEEEVGAVSKRINLKKGGKLVYVP